MTLAINMMHWNGISDEMRPQLQAKKTKVKAILAIDNIAQGVICDRPWENRPSSHLGMIMEIPF